MGSAYLKVWKSKSASEKTETGKEKSECGKKASRVAKLLGVAI